MTCWPCKPAGNLPHARVRASNTRRFAIRPGTGYAVITGGQYPVAGKSTKGLIMPGYDYGFVIACDTTRFRQRRADTATLKRELFQCHELRATPFLSREQVADTWPRAHMEPVYAAGGLIFVQLEPGNDNVVVTRLVRALGEETTAQGTWWVASLDGKGLDEGQVQAVADALKGATVRL